MFFERDEIECCSICGENKEICPSEETCTFKIIKDIDINIFEKHGFKRPSFQCEIFKKIGKDYFGYLRTKEWEGNEYISCFWDENGLLNKDYLKKHVAAMLDNKYNLIPINKWYKNENIFPCVVKNIHTNLYDVAQDYVSYEGCDLIKIAERYRDANLFKFIRKDIELCEES